MSSNVKKETIYIIIKKIILNSKIKKYTLCSDRQNIVRPSDIWK